jgi:hypothetical protein
VGLWARSALWGLGLCCEWQEGRIFGLWGGLGFRRVLVLGGSWF